MECHIYEIIFIEQMYDLFQLTFHEIVYNLFQKEYMNNFIDVLFMEDY